MQQALTGVLPRQLKRTVLAVRVRLWWRHVAELTLNGLALGSVAGVLLVLAAMWQAQEPSWLHPTAIASIVALLGLMLGLLRLPSRASAARLADSRLGLEERLATALEILDGRLASPMAARQLDDAWRAVDGRPLAMVTSLDDLRLPALRTALALILFVGGLLLADQYDPQSNPVADARRTLDELALRAGVLAQAVAQLPMAAQSEELDPFATVPPPPMFSPQTEQQLREQMARSRNQQMALSRLARALMGTAAAREIGEQLERGDYGRAAAGLRNLARENDQLSPQAKRELSDALRRAATDTMDVSADLASQEERAARALAGRDYRSTQQSLERLSQGLSDASQDIVPQEQLAQALQRLQEQRGEGDMDLDTSGSTSDGDFQFAEGSASAVGGGMAFDDDSGMLSPNGAPSSNAGAFNPNAKPTRLNVAGREVEIQGRPVGRGEGRGPSRSSSPALTINDAEESGALLEGVPQPTDPVRDTAERTNVPFSHMQTVQEYFKSGEKP